MLSGRAFASCVCGDDDGDDVSNVFSPTIRLSRNQTLILLCDVLLPSRVHRSR